MGWSGGTYLFDTCCKLILDEKTPKEKKIVKLIEAFEDEDWDTQNESNYWDDPIVRKAFKKLHPDWDYE